MSSDGQGKQGTEEPLLHQHRILYCNLSSLRYHLVYATVLKSFMKQARHKGNEATNKSNVCQVMIDSKMPSQPALDKPTLYALNFTSSLLLHLR